MSSSGDGNVGAGGDMVGDVVIADEPMKEGTQTTDSTYTRTKTRTKEVTEAYVYSDGTYVDKKVIDRELDEIDALIAKRKKELQERAKMAKMFRQTSADMKSRLAASNTKGDKYGGTSNSTLWTYRISVVVLLLLAGYNYFIDYRPRFLDEYRLTS